MQIYLKKDMPQNFCIYIFYFVTGGCKKLGFGAQKKWKNSCEFGDHEKVKEARGLQKVIVFGRRNQEKLRLCKNCWTANNLCIKNSLLL